MDKIYLTAMFSDNGQQGAVILRKGKWGESWDCPVFIPGGIFLTQGQNRGSRKYVNLTKLRQHRSEFMDIAEHGGIDFWRKGSSFKIMQSFESSFNTKILMYREKLHKVML